MADKPNMITPFPSGAYRNYLPSAYDPSMSVYEQLVQMIAYINEMNHIVGQMIDYTDGRLDGQDVIIKDIGDKVTQIRKEFEEFRIYIDENIEQFVDEDLKKMVKNGTFDYVFEESIFKNMNAKIDTKADKQYVNDKVSQIGNMNPKGVYPTLEALKAAKPNGDTGIYVVSGDGKWYYWNATEWVSGGTYQGTQFANNSVVREKIKRGEVTEEKFRSKLVVSKNLINKHALKEGGYWAENGTWVVNAGFKVSDYVPVLEDHSYTAVNDRIVTYWDNNYNFLGGRAAGVGATVKIPTGQNIAYAVWTFQQSNDKPQINEGTKVLEYDEFRVEDDNLAIKQKNMGNSPKILPKMIEVPSENLFDKNDVIQGYFDVDGNFVEDSTWMVSGFIPIEEGQDYTQLTAGIRTIYDDTKRFVGAITGLPPFKIPTGKNAKFIRIITQVGRLDTEMFVKGTAYPTAYIPYRKYAFDTNYYSVMTKKSKLDGLSWNAYGDSITENFKGDNYVTMIANAFGVKPINVGLSGRTIASRPSQDPTYPPAVLDYVNMQSGSDITTIWCGTNDYGNQIPLGAKDSVDIKTFNGALNVLCTGMIDKFAGKKIAFITPMLRRDLDKPIKLQEYVDAIKFMGNKYGIPVFDMYNNCGLNPTNDKVNNTYFSNQDGLHPLPIGYRVFFNKIGSFMEAQ